MNSMNGDRRDAAEFARFLDGRLRVRAGIRSFALSFGL
jgi:hypothetical protein